MNFQSQKIYVLLSIIASAFGGKSKVTVFTFKVSVLVTLLNMIFFILWV